MSSPAVQPILALLACPVGGNPTQYAFEKAFEQMKLDWRFLSTEVAPEELADAVRGIKAMGFRGAAIAPPHRRAALPLVDEASETAQLLGRVNVVRRQDNRLLGENTEGRGLLAALRRFADPANKRCLVLEANDPGQAAAVELAAAGAAEVRIVDASAERAAAAAELLTKRFPGIVSSQAWEDNFRIPDEMSIVVRAAPAAKRNGPAPSFDVDSLRADMIVADLAIDPRDAWLLREAAARQCRTINGLDALVEQIAADFRLWTGLDPDVHLMREAVEEFLEL